MQPRRAIERIYVVGAYVPNGGTWMAYHLGRILHQHFGRSVTVVTVGDETPGDGAFTYDPQFPTLPLTELEAAVHPDDLLICNPSFAKYQFGLRLKCQKLMYIQGFSTFNLLDRFFDHYVSVSRFVADFIRNTYGLATPVIPPFIAPPPPATPWRDRPPLSVGLHLKGPYSDQPLLLDRLRSHLPAAVAQRIAWSEPLVPERVRRPHSDLVADLGRTRFLLSLSVGEGFGLVPLEAMAQGTVVAGFDGFGGRDYMHPGVNCAVRPYPDIEGAAEALARVLTDPVHAATLSEAGRKTAEAYSYAAFRDAWIAAFEARFDLVRLSEPA